ncbi:hypothetical protein DASC09_009410 [Saccharomycopsis crataegensis]|uniref:Uncharacterized protein n=1 Tax=Saccharomycopsis crataegensis TaxID=43959 RepID=A0AAV5QG86_9ASCO|nr:hypothetical protein DASC09_009410 [Saccharomycopsis crataegensis]
MYLNFNELIFHTYISKSSHSIRRFNCSIFLTSPRVLSPLDPHLSPNLQLYGNGKNFSTRSST